MGTVTQSVNRNQIYSYKWDTIETHFYVSHSPDCVVGMNLLFERFLRRENIYRALICFWKIWSELNYDIFKSIYIHRHFINSGLQLSSLYLRYVASMSQTNLLVFYKHTRVDWVLGFCCWRYVSFSGTILDRRRPSRERERRDVNAFGSWGASAEIPVGMLHRDLQDAWLIVIEVMYANQR